MSTSIWAKFLHAMLGHNINTLYFNSIVEVLFRRALHLLMAFFHTVSKIIDPDNEPIEMAG